MSHTMTLPTMSIPPYNATPPYHATSPYQVHRAEEEHALAQAGMMKQGLTVVKPPIATPTTNIPGGHDEAGPYYGYLPALL